MDLETLDSPEFVDEEEAFPEQVEEQEVRPTIVEEAQPGVLEELSPSNIMIRLLSKLMPQEGVAEFEPGYGVELDNAPVEVPEVNVEDDRLEDEWTEQPDSLSGQPWRTGGEQGSSNYPLLKVIAYRNNDDSFNMIHKIKVQAIIIDKHNYVNLYLSLLNQDVIYSKDVIRYKHKAYRNNMSLFKYISQYLINDVFLR